jgi:hypothetical protein
MTDWKKMDGVVKGFFAKLDTLLENDPDIEANSTQELIDYAELYDVQCGETDFGGAMKRALGRGLQHLSSDFTNAVSHNKK